MIAAVKGRAVAVVGRAGSLVGSGNGGAIDSADVVVRVNWVLPIDTSLAGDIGSRTDLLFHCVNLCSESRASAERHGVPTATFRPVDRRRMVRKLGRNPKKYQPNTGLVAVLAVIRSRAVLPVAVYGMDGYRTGYPEGPVPPVERKTWAWDHDPSEDLRILGDLWRRGQVAPDAALRSAIEAVA